MGKKSADILFAPQINFFAALAFRVGRPTTARMGKYLQAAALHMYEVKDERSFTTFIAMQRLEIGLVQLSCVKLHHVLIKF